ncbi:hypothetical protein Cadr_000027462 [Camelus dromedarius]|uniref:Uncharacterized protein n=1 Tax=Camelus dromedarius TaxID=9838 RepID=A0A5N4CCC2_CAMDR|nr:hypothetical protein Cadr_000027462 [Camelus dromedarius]
MPGEANRRFKSSTVQLQCFGLPGSKVITSRLMQLAKVAVALADVSSVLDSKVRITRAFRRPVRGNPKASSHRLHWQNVAHGSWRQSRVHRRQVHIHGEKAVGDATRFQVITHRVRTQRTKGNQLRLTLADRLGKIQEHPLQ